MPISREHNYYLSALQAEVKDLTYLLDLAQDAQWSRSRRLGRLEMVKGKGGPPGDPTGDAAVDTRRLRLREVLKGSEKSLERALKALVELRSDLNWALTRWEGEVPPKRRGA